MCGDVDETILNKFCGCDTERDGRSGDSVEGLSEGAGKQGRGRDHDCVAGSLAHADGDCRIAGGQGMCMWRSPCSHNPAEGAMLVAAQKKYGKVVQMGTQQRSSRHTIEVIEKIRAGEIGRPYLAKAWYSNTRKSIGVGKEAAVPTTLDWDLWQGAGAAAGVPRQTYIHITGIGSGITGPANR